MVTNFIGFNNMALSGKGVRVPQGYCFPEKSCNEVVQIPAQATEGRAHGEILQRTPSQSYYTSSSQDLSGRHAQLAAMINNKEQSNKTYQPSAPGNTDGSAGHTPQYHQNHQRIIRA